MHEDKIEMFTNVIAHLMVTVPDTLENSVVQLVITNKAEAEEDREKLVSKRCKCLTFKHTCI